MVADDTSLIEGADRLRADGVIVDLSLARDSSLSGLQALRYGWPGSQQDFQGFSERSNACGNLLNNS